MAWTAFLRLGQEYLGDPPEETVLERKTIFDDLLDGRMMILIHDTETEYLKVETKQSWRLGDYHRDLLGNRKQTSF